MKKYSILKSQLHLQKPHGYYSLALLVTGGMSSPNKVLLLSLATIPDNIYQDSELFDTTLEMPQVYDFEVSPSKEVLCIYPMGFHELYIIFMSNYQLALLSANVT